MEELEAAYVSHICNKNTETIKSQQLVTHYMKFLQLPFSHQRDVATLAYWFLRQ